VDFVTSVGHGTGTGSRQEYGFTGRGPTVVITDIGVMRPDPVTSELVLTAVHPGRTVEEAMAATGWPLRVADDVAITELPTVEELTALRRLRGA
jgi:glutaconate CoA-transferase subunit B